MSIPAAFDLSGRVAVVTGAGSPDGIGFATARLLAELGAAVMITATTARDPGQGQRTAQRWL
jgi:3-oxoacyl-[acyl-carrier protein] reductase